MGSANGDAFLYRSHGLLQRPSNRVSLEPGLSQAALDAELSEGSVASDTLAREPAIFLAHLYRDERRSAEALQELAQGAAPWGLINAERVIAWVEQRLGLELAASRKATHGG